MDVVFVIILSTLILFHALEHFYIFSGIIIICIIFNRLNRNTSSRVTSLFEMSIKKMINFAKSFLFNDSDQKICFFLEIYKFGQHIVCHNLSLLKIKHK